MPEPGTTPEPVTTPTPGSTVQTGILSVGLALCADAACESNDERFDGYTVTWMVTPQQTTATHELDSYKMAASGMVGKPVTLQAIQQAQGFTITGVLDGGIAVGTSGPLPIGTYSVCLNPVIIGPNGESVNIATAEVCAEANVRSAGHVLQPFSGVSGSVLPGDPADLTDSEDGAQSPGTPSGEAVAQAGGGAITDQVSVASQGVTNLPNTGTGTPGNSNDAVFFASLILAGMALAGLRGVRIGNRN